MTEYSEGTDAIFVPYEGYPVPGAGRQCMVVPCLCFRPKDYVEKVLLNVPPIQEVQARTEGRARNSRCGVVTLIEQCRTRGRSVMQGKEYSCLRLAIDAPNTL